MKRHTFQELVDIQSKFDLQHGFTIDNSSTIKKYNQISRDLIGLYGEVGEFSNIVKKINLIIDHQSMPSASDLLEKEAELGEELVDTFIYLIRLAKALNLDLESEYLEKLKKNKVKYFPYER